jgi:hypothetical protein
MGGGSVRPGPQAIALTATGTGYAYRISGGVTCGRRKFIDLVVTGQFTPAADGSFSATGRVRSPGLIRRRSLTGSYQLTGTMTGPTSASGNITTTARLKRGGKRLKCHVDRGEWSARAQAQLRGTHVAGPLAGPLFGTTSQHQGLFSYPVVLHPWKRGQVYMVWEAGTRCTRGVRLFPFVNVTPAMRPNAQGQFHVRERFSVQYADGLTRFTETSTGQLLSDGAAGFVRLRETRLRQGRVLTRCDSGTVGWTAVP